MKMTARACAFGIISIALSTTGCWSRVGVASDLGLDFWNLNRLDTEMKKSAQIGLDLDRKLMAVMRRCALKQDLAVDLIDGRITLSEAAVRYRELNSMEPVLINLLRDAIPAGTDEIRAARQVIEFVTNADHPRGLEVAAKLKRELSQ